MSGADDQHRVEVSCPLPLTEVRARLAGGLVPGWRIALPAGHIVGAVGERRLRARLPSTGRRFPAVLDATLAPAGRGCLIRGRVRRGAASTALVVALAVLELALIAASVAAATTGTPFAVAAPVVFLFLFVPLAVRVRRIAPADVAALRAWLDARLAPDLPTPERPGPSRSGEAAAGPGA